MDAPKQVAHSALRLYEGRNNPEDRARVIEFVRANATSKAFGLNVLNTIFAPGMMEVFHNDTILSYYEQVLERC